MVKNILERRYVNMPKTFKSYKEMDDVEKGVWIFSITGIILTIGVMVLFVIQNPQPFPQYNWSILGKCLSF